MASIRLFKKDIVFLTSELINQAYINQVLFKKTDEELRNEVQNALDFRNSIYDGLKFEGDKKNSKEVRKHYSDLRMKMIEEFGKLYNISE